MTGHDGFSLELWEGIEQIRQAGGDSPEALGLARVLMRSCEGPEGERVLADLIGRFSPETIRALVVADLMNEPADTPHDFFGSSGIRLVRGRLALLGNVSALTAAEVRLLDDTDVTTLLPRVGEEDPIRFFRVALLTLWLHKMRQGDPLPPSY